MGYERSYAMEVILIIIAAAVLANQISIESSLAFSIKRFLYLDFEQECLLKKLSTIKFWSLLWGMKYYIILYPLTIFISLFFKIYVFINRLVNCPYCLSFHLTWIALFLMGYGAWSFVYGLLSIIVCKLYEKL